MREVFAIGIVLFCIFLLGIWGQYVLDPEQFSALPLQALYNTLTLFVFEGDWTSDFNLPWQLEITRFLAPLAMIAGVLVYLTQGAWLKVVNSFVRLRQDHIVVAGLGKLSWHFVQSCHGAYKLVIVESNPDNPYIERARALKMSVIVGDILDPVIFDQVNLAAAKHLVAFTGSDGVNVELAIKARSYMRERASEPLLVHMHVENTHIAERLENYPKFFADSASAQVNFFSVYHLNSRILFRDYPPESFAHYFGQNQVHIALYNFGQQAEHILLEAIRVCHYANESQIRFSVFDRDANAKGVAFLATYPYLESLCSIKFYEIPVLQAKMLDEIYVELLRSVTEHVVCFERDEDNLNLALLLRSILLNKKNSNAPIIVHMEQSSGLAQLLESNFGGPEIPDGLYPFGMLDQVLHFENVLADGLDVLARAFHETYLEERGGLDVDVRLYSTLYDWVALSEPERASNRQSADHSATKLRAIGCRIIDTVDTEFSFSDEEALLLARMEHNRWCAEKIAHGWQYGPERIESAKVNPVIGKWENLNPGEQQRQVDQIKTFAALIARKIQKGIAREFCIGITGHRLHKLNPSDEKLKAEIEGALQKLVDANPKRKFILMSPLAEGADRLVARIAMEKFGMALHVPLPLPFELYQTDFTSTHSVEEFKVLVGKSEIYYELPMRFGNQMELASRLGGVANEQRNKQYAMVGAYIVEHCDAMLAIWDGEKAHGTGGTGQVVEWRKGGAADPEYVIRSEFFRAKITDQPVVIAHQYSGAKQD